MPKAYIICSSVITLAFFLGGYLLESMGVKYVSEGGIPLLKIHTYSYIILLATAFFTLKEGARVQIQRLDTLKTSWLLSVILVSFVIVYGLVRYGTSGMAYIIDTFLTPLLFLLLLSRLNVNECQQLVSLIAFLLLFNSSIAILEFISSTRLVDVEFSSFGYFRSSALLTHPLNNALITAGLTLLVFNKSRIPNIIYLAITLLAMFAFGGRAALGILLIFSLIASIPYVFGFFTYGIGISRQRFAVMLCILYFSIIIVGFVLIESGITERIMNKLHIDGSASARFSVLYLLDLLSPNEWIFGASKNLQSAIEVYLGISVIENFIIAWIYKFGLLGMIPLLTMVLLTLCSLSFKSRGLAYFSVLIFLIVSTSNNSLSTKTPALLLMFSSLYLCFRVNQKSNN